MGKKKLQWIVLLCVVSIGAVAALMVYRSTIFRMTGTEPGLDKVSVISPFIDVTFSKPLDKPKTALHSDTTLISSFEFPNDKTLRIFFDELKLGEQNTIILETIAATNGKELQNIQLEFESKDITFEDMTKAQQEAILKNQDRPDVIKDDPIMEHLPYSSLNFELKANSVNGSLVLEARLLLSAADVRLGANTAIEAYKKEVQDYIRSLGLDPTKYTINYEVVQPTL